MNSLSSIKTATSETVVACALGAARSSAGEIAHLGLARTPRVQASEKTNMEKLV